MKRRLLLQQAVAGSAAGALPMLSWAADEWPTKSVRMVVPFPAGGGTDAVARIVCGELSKRLGQQTYVDNRAGGNMFIGAVEGQRSAPDGYTFLFALDSLFTINPSAYAKLPYDPVSGFTPVSLVTTQAQWWVARPELGVRTMGELLAKLKGRPGSINYGYGSPSGQLTAELFRSVTGEQLNLIPYKGGGPAGLALLGGEIDVLGADMGSLLQHIKAGKMIPLGQTGTTRSAVLPEVPTMQEQGLKGFESLAWFAVFAPAGTPAPIVQKLGTELNQVLSRADIRQQILALGYEAGGSTPQGLADRLRADECKWAKVIRASNFKLD